MSDSEAYMLAIENAIIVAIASEISGAARNDKFVGRSHLGKPIAMADDFFISIHDGSADNQTADGGHYQDDYHGCQITFSQRTGVTPEDRLGDVALPALRARISTVTSYLSNNRYTVMNAANALLNLTAADGFVEPMLVVSPMVAIVSRRGDWFHCRDKMKSESTDGISATIRMGKARRVQYVGAIN